MSVVAALSGQSVDPVSVQQTTEFATPNTGTTAEQCTRRTQTLYYRNSAGETVEVTFKVRKNGTGVDNNRLWPDSASLKLKVTVEAV